MLKPELLPQTPTSPCSLSALQLRGHMLHEAIGLSKNSKRDPGKYAFTLSELAGKDTRF